MSDANRTRLLFAQETTWNTPATASMTELRLTGESLVPEIETITSAELRSDRMISDVIQTSRQNSGGFDFEFSYATFNSLLEGAMFEAWSGLTLNNGITKKFYTIEKGHLDIDEYFLFSGMMVNTFTLNLATSSICTGNITFLGSDATLSQVTNAVATVSANTNDVFNCMGNVATIQEGNYSGAYTNMNGIYIQELSFTINNNLRPVHAIGFDTIQEVAVGKMDVTGNMNVYFTNDRLFDKFLAGSALKLKFQLSSGGSSYIFEFPRVKFETESTTAPGQDQDVIENMTWRALKDDTTGVQARIIKSS
jgi:hypothetical protein